MIVFSIEVTSTAGSVGDGFLSDNLGSAAGRVWDECMTDRETVNTDARKRGRSNPTCRRVCRSVLCSFKQPSIRQRDKGLPG